MFPLRVKFRICPPPVRFRVTQSEDRVSVGLEFNERRGMYYLRLGVDRFYTLPHNAPDSMVFQRKMHC